MPTKKNELVDHMRVRKARTQAYISPLKRLRSSMLIRIPITICAANMPQTWLLIRDDYAGQQSAADWSDNQQANIAISTPDERGSFAVSHTLT